MKKIQDLSKEQLDSMVGDIVDVCDFYDTDGTRLAQHLVKKGYQVASNYDTGTHGEVVTAEGLHFSTNGYIFIPRVTVKMATKQQEQDTLNEIVVMLEKLGPESYVETALKYALRVAQDNINNDWLMNAKDAFRGEIKDPLLKEISELKGKLESAEGVIKDLDKQRKEQASKNDDLQDALDDSRSENGLLELSIQSKNLEIMKLKAKLYDLTIDD